jgi:hypothetical protein
LLLFQKEALPAFMNSSSDAAASAAEVAAAGVAVAA